MSDFMGSVNGLESPDYKAAYENSPVFTQQIKDAEKLAGSVKQDDKELKKACQSFESIFINLLLKDMRKTIQKNELFSGGRAEETFQGLLDTNFAEKASMKGEGLGIGKMMYEYLSRQKVVQAYKYAKMMSEIQGSNLTE
ncbi:MAG: rod-binding protein [Planctomycetes bacterium]|nr:rod-binding protein [Planctomycetota bacterium]